MQKHKLQMKLLDKDKYNLVLEPLKDVKVNNLFARSVIEKHVTGSVFVDDTSEPTSFCVVHPYGMALVFGATTNKEFNQHLIAYMLNKSGFRTKVEWLQAFPPEWNEAIIELLGINLFTPITSTLHKSEGLVELNTRINFKFNKAKYLDFKNTLELNPFDVVRTDSLMFEKMNGTVVPKYFWDDADSFLNRGIGFSILDAGDPVSTAFSAFVHDDKLEIGIETYDTQRGRGLAYYTCSALIDFCIGANLEPIWACRLENTGSVRLAERLGFEQAKYIPYYKLPFINK